jgi:hypothetical protein
MQKSNKKDAESIVQTNSRAITPNLKERENKN